MVWWNSSKVKQFILCITPRSNINIGNELELITFIKQRRLPQQEFYGLCVIMIKAICFHILTIIVRL